MGFVSAKFILRTYPLHDRMKNGTRFRKELIPLTPKLFMDVVESNQNKTYLVKWRFLVDLFLWKLFEVSLTSLLLAERSVFFHNQITLALLLGQILVLAFKFRFCCSFRLTLLGIIFFGFGIQILVWIDQITFLAFHV